MSANLQINDNYTHCIVIVFVTFLPFLSFQELIQNADDAEASEVKFILDSSHHPPNNLIHERLSRFQGPALFAWNNAVFKEEDWDHFGKMEESSKEKDALKVGRFGVGFLSVFHITGSLYKGYSQAYQIHYAQLID